MGWIYSFLTLFLLVQPMNFLSRSLNLSSSSRKNDSGLLNRAFVQVQPEKMSYRKMPSHFRPPAPVSPAAATALRGRSSWQCSPCPLRSEGWSSELLHGHSCTLRAVFTPRLGDAEPQVSFCSSKPQLWPAQHVWPWISSWEFSPRKEFG